MNKLLSRIIGKYRRTLAYRFHRRMTVIETPVPIISFTFDDAPRSAFTTGGNILSSHNARGTFFISLGLLGSQTEGGVIATPADLSQALTQGHELGSHTFDHLDTWETSPQKFIASVVANNHAFSRMFPAMSFRTFSYPKSEPNPSIKHLLEEFFICSRGGGQTLNSGMVDLNLLKAYFLDRRNNVNIDEVQRLIDRNTSCRGWLIFATHDVTGTPSPYGITPEFFGKVVQYAVRSGALLLPVAEACDRLHVHLKECINSKS